MFTLKQNNRPLITFHMGDPKPSTVYIGDIVYLMADGDELEFIRSRFDNIPIIKGSRCTWTGEMAAFIFRNLPIQYRKETT